MKKTLLIAALLSPLALTAQNPLGNIAETETVRFVEHNDTIDYVIRLHENAPHQYNVPDVPRFALWGKEGKFYMGIGANLKAIALYDFGHPLDNPGKFIPSEIPMTIDPGSGALMRITAQTSSLYLNVVALPGSADQLGAYVAVNFAGKSNALNLLHAYLKYRGIKAGYTFSLFTDASAMPPTVDFQGPNAAGAMKRGMISYERSVGKDNGWGLGIGIDMPQVSTTNADHTATVTQRTPDIPFYVQRNWAEGKGWFRLTGIVRNLYYRDVTDGKNKDVVGWGIKGTGSTPIYDGLKAYYQCLYGKGIANCIQDLTGHGMDLMPDPDNSGRLEAVKAWSGFAGLQYNFTPKLFVTAVYSHVRTYADDYVDSSTPWGTGYRYAQYLTGNCFYNINSIVQLGLEYLYGRRVDYSGMQAHDNRLQAMLQVSF